MTGDNVFSFDASMAARMRRTVFLPLLLILPLAAIFGLDPSKSQPIHFLMTFGIGVACGAIVVFIGRGAVNRRIAHLSGLVLSIENDQVIWTSAIGRSVVEFDRIRCVRIHERSGKARAIVLILKDGSRTRLDGFVGMSELAEILTSKLPSSIEVRRTWMPL